MKVECGQSEEAENVDYEKASYWPVFVALLVVLIVPFRNTIQVWHTTQCLRVLGSDRQLCRKWSDQRSENGKGIGCLL